MGASSPRRPTQTLLPPRLRAPFSRHAPNPPSSSCLLHFPFSAPPLRTTSSSHLTSSAQLLALLEGTNVRTPRGLVSTSHILFVCAGAFHQSKPADLLPELQGRLPVRVELKSLTEADFVRILTDTTFNLLLQQTKV